jgi:plastocyanin
MYVVGGYGQGSLRRVDDFNGASIPVIGSTRSGHLTALDTRTNRIAWQKDLPFPMGNGSGTMTTSGGLVLLGTPDGYAMAFDATTGDELWKFQTGFGADAGPATYELDGEQYVVYATGGGRGSLGNGDGVWSFKLGGRLNQLYPPPTASRVVAFTGTPVPSNAVQIQTFAFTPDRIVVPVGTTVTWTNRDGEPHTATEQTGRWDTGLIREGEPASITFDTRGTYTYYCAPHPWMVAQLIVQ